MFKLTLNFNSLDELKNFLEEKTKPIKPKKEKKDGDRRGQNIKTLHSLAKAYHFDHPEIPYKSCLKLVNKKENTFKEIDNDNK